MHYSYRNVNDAFYGIVCGIVEGRIPVKKQSTRNGTVLRIEDPVTITYRYPWERVLFNEVRDCNPFFHLFEAIWMLAGRNDVKPLKYYDSDVRALSDDGKTLHGACGYRWRRGMGYDQLEEIYKVLYHLPSDRRAVLQMWDGQKRYSYENSKLQLEYEGGHDDLRAGGNGCKDVPSNLVATFEVINKKLNMTVVSRSNDLVQGMFGANLVHFSFLQEYMAAKLQVKVGKYHQISTNLHTYLETWKGNDYLPTKFKNFYDSFLNIESSGLVADPNQFIRECEEFVDNQEMICKEPFLANTAQPMCLAFRHHKEKDYNKASEAVNRIKSVDWHLASSTWINKRRKKWEAKK